MAASMHLTPQDFSHPGYTLVKSRPNAWEGSSPLNRYAACSRSNSRPAAPDLGDCSEVVTIYPRTLIVYESGFAEYEDDETGVYWAGDDLREVPDEALVNAYFHLKYDPLDL
jgi:hypothetical protein